MTTLARLPEVAEDSPFSAGTPSKSVGVSVVDMLKLPVVFCKRVKVKFFSYFSIS